jgi:hypothetical protein
MPQQAPIGTSQYSASPPVDISPNFANPMYPPRQVGYNQSYGRTSFSQGVIQKIQEFKLLINRYSSYHTNPDEIIRLAIFNSINGDDALLDSKLEQLRSIHAISKTLTF